MAEAMKLAYADRSQYLGDSDFYPVPVTGLISKEYAGERGKLMEATVATPSRMIPPGVIPLKAGTHTTHYSVVDSWGNAVSVNTTINSWFGNKIVVGGAGFFLNNEMDDFSAKPGVANIYGLVGGEANSIQPGKRMLSSMTPTIVLKDDKPFLVVGSPGGSTIITTVLQVILNVIDHKMNIQAAINYPRIHQQWMPDVVYVEKGALTPDVQKELTAQGYKFQDDVPWGEAEGIVIGAKNGKRMLYGANDGRVEAGAAIGY